MSDSSNRGYVAIVVAFLIPLALIGVKWSLSTINQNGFELIRSKSANLCKKCAKEAALAAAKKYNPGEPLSVQFGIVQKAADDVYNAFPCYHDSTIGEALYGVDRVVSASAGVIPGYFMPITVKNVKTESTLASRRQIEYKHETVTLCRRKSKSEHPNTLAMRDCYLEMCYTFDEKKGTDKPGGRLANIVRYAYDNEDIFNRNQVATDGNYYTETFSNYTYGNNAGASSLTTIKHTRKDKNDSKLSLLIEKDAIKVITDQVDTGCAVPAECNVDIVLSIPTNSAACNSSNRDKNTPTVGTPYSTSAFSESASSSSISVPICEIARAYRSFLKNNFFYTRGVYVSLIPYSGKAAFCYRDTVTAIGKNISTDDNHWWTEFPKFSEGAFHDPYLFGVLLYSSKGQQEKALYQDKYDMRNFTGKSGFSTFARIGYLKNLSNYGNNKLMVLDLLSSEAPGTGSSDTITDKTKDEYYLNKYPSWNANPCAVEHANLLGMKCEKTCPTYYAQPYYIFPAQADLRMVYEILGIMYPISYDDHNESNFTFIPITWANNCFRDWTYDPVRDATSDQLSLPSKNKANRKKALILIVNKPDHFETGELTYIGFNNDFSEVPAMSSDKIDFTINYGQNATASNNCLEDYVRNIDGSDYNGTIQGPRKILKYNVTSGTLTYKSGKYKFPSTHKARLTFPQKGTVKIVAKVRVLKEPELNNFKDVNSNLSTVNSDYWRCHALAYGNGKFVAMNANGDLAYSSNAISWTKSSFTLPYNSRSTDSTGGVEFGNGIFVAMSSDGHIAYSSNGISWTGLGQVLSGSYWYNLHYDGSKFIAADESNHFAFSNTGTSWPSESFTDSQFGYNWRGGIMYANGKYVFLHRDGDIAISTDAKNWTKKSSLSGDFIGGTCAAEGYFIALQTSGTYYYSEDGENWTKGTANLSSIQSSGWYSICYVNGSMYALNVNGKIAVCEFPFGAIGSNPTGTITINGNTYSIDEEKALYIQASEISDTKDGDNYYIDISLTNLQLLSVEITNRGFWEPVEPKSVTHKDVEYGGVSVEKINDIYEDVTETIDFSNGETSSASVSFESGSGGKMNSGNGYDLISTGEVTCKFSSKYNCKATLEVEPTHEPSGLAEKWEKTAELDSEYFYCYTIGVLPSESKIAIVDFALDYGDEQCTIWISNDFGYNWIGKCLTTWNFCPEGMCGYESSNKKSFACINDRSSLYRIDASTNSLIGEGSLYYGVYGRGICYIDGKMVALNRKGYIAVSENGGTDWTEQPSSKKRALEDIGPAIHPKAKKGSDTFVEKLEWRGICGLNHKVYVLDKYGNLGISSDYGATWYNGTSLGKRYSSSRKYDWTSICSIGNKLVALSTYGDIAISSDGGSSWTKSKPSLPTLKTDRNSSGWYRRYQVPNCWAGIGSIGNYLIAISRYGEVAVSTNDQPTITVGSGSKQNISSYKTTSGNFSGSGSSYSLSIKAHNVRIVKTTFKFTRVKPNMYKISSSKKGTALLRVRGSPWTIVNGESQVCHVCYGKGMFVSADRGGSDMGYSTDGGHNWSFDYLGGDEEYSYGIYDLQPADICYGDGMFLALDKTGRLIRSYDGHGDWEEFDNLRYIGCRSSSEFYSICYDDDFVYALGDSALHQVKNMDEEPWWDGGDTAGNGKIRYCNGNLICMDSDYVYRYNCDYDYDYGSWSCIGSFPQTLNDYDDGWYSDGWQDFCYGNGMYVAISELGEIATSPDGEDWKSCGYVDQFHEPGWSGICYGDGQFLAVNGTDGGIAVCADPTKLPSFNSTPINGETTVTVDLTNQESGRYYAEAQMENLEVTRNAVIYEKTDTVDDLIAFCDNTTAKNGVLQASVSGSLVDGLYTCSSGSGTITINNGGTLKLTVAPDFRKESGALTFTTGSNTSRKNVSSQQTFEIKTYEQKFLGDCYQVSFKMEDLVLISAEFVWNGEIQIPVRPPLRSSCVDFTRATGGTLKTDSSGKQIYEGGKPVYDSSKIIYGSTTAANIPQTTTYDLDVGYWVATAGNNGFFGMEPQYKSPFWFISDEFGTRETFRKNIWYVVDRKFDWQRQLYLPGMVRTTYTADEAIKFGFSSIGGSRKTALISAGFMDPINCALYYGYGNGKLFNYNWQGTGSEQSNSVSQRDPDEALKQVTKDACKKLIDDCKERYGSDSLRIYVIKYRAQQSHTYRKRSGEDTFTLEENENDYTYLEDCAYGQSGLSDSEPYLTEADSESELKEKLQAIADDIKEFAGYEEAHVVE